MNDTLIGYARCSTDKQDLTAQRERLREVGVTEKRIYLDHGLTGTNRKRPGLNQALAAVREGDTLVVPKPDRLARSVPDARDIGDSLAQRGIKLSLGGQVYDPTDPMGKMFFNILATFAEFEVDLLRMKTREGMAVARAKGRLRGKQPKDPLSARRCRGRRIVRLRVAATGRWGVRPATPALVANRASHRQSACWSAAAASRGASLPRSPGVRTR
jgi:DNA invertase Pin-like site-specific DNA recombinase